MTPCPVSKCRNFRNPGQLTCFPHYRKIPVAMRKKIFGAKDGGLDQKQKALEAVEYLEKLELSKNVV